MALHVTWLFKGTGILLFLSSHHRDLAHSLPMDAIIKNKTPSIDCSRCPIKIYSSNF